MEGSGFRVQKFPDPLKDPLIPLDMVLGDGSFRKFGVHYLGVLIIRILLFRVLYWGPPIFGNSPNSRG